MLDYPIQYEQFTSKFRTIIVRVVFENKLTFNKLLNLFAQLKNSINSTEYSVNSYTLQLFNLI